MTTKLERPKVAAWLRPANYLYLDYLKELNTVNQLDSNKHIHTVNRYSLKTLAYFACVQLDSRKINSVGHLDAAASEPTKGGSKQKWCVAIYAANLLSSLKRTLTSNLVLVPSLYYVCSLHLIVNSIYQYSYDFDLMRVKKIAEQRSNNLVQMVDGKARNMSDIQLQLTKRIQLTKLVLESIGAPHLNLSVTIEFVYVYIILLAFILFYWSYVYNRFVTPCDMQVIREHLHHDNELKVCARLIKEEVLSFCESSKLFNMIKRSRTNQLLQSALSSDLKKTQQQQQQQQHLSDSNLKFNEHRQRLDKNKLKIERILATMFASRALTPFNKSLRWYNKRTKLMLIYQASILSYALAFFLIFMRTSATPSAAAAGQVSSQAKTIMDTLIEVSVWALIALISLSKSLYNTHFFFTSLDQIVLVNQIRNLIHRCIRINAIEFERLNLSASSEVGQALSRSDSIKSAQQTGCFVVDSKLKLKKARRSVATVDEFAGGPNLAHLKIGPLVDDNDLRNCAAMMNANLLFVLMHYKIFLAQSRPIIRSLNTLVIIVSAMLLLIPIMVKLHLPYFNIVHRHDITVFAIALSATALIPTNFGIIPLCYLHNRCLDLYGALASLNSHLVSIGSQPNGKNLYDKYAALMVTKELSNSEQFRNKFEASLAGFSGTYATLMQIHFWWGILAISIIFNNKSDEQGLIESLLNDPLGIL